MVRVAWKILRGAVVASTEMVTFGGVAAKAEIDAAKRQRIPRTFRAFIQRTLGVSAMDGIVARIFMTIAVIAD